jgi:lon-related putative ATP-dependent protease
MKFDTTDKVVPVQGTIGQDRAMKALKLGLELYSPGYNIYVSGLVGTGRTTTVKELLTEISPRCSIPRDRAYVRNFGERDRPRLPSVFESKDVSSRREEIVERFGEREQSQVSEFQERLAEEGLALVSIQAGPVPRPDIFPVYQGKPVSPQEFEQLVEAGEIPRERLERIEVTVEEFRKELHDHLRRGRALAREMSKEISDLHREIGLAVIEGQLEDLRDRLAENEAVLAFLAEVETDVLDNLPLLASAQDGEGAAVVEAHYGSYQVNVISDHSHTVGCPVVVGTNPSFTSLFGTIERIMEQGGVWRTDHTMIRGGTLLEADGGYLILNALDVLQQAGVWPILMRALKSDQLEIGLPDQPFLGMTTGLKPEAIDLNVKVILIGEPSYYNLLYSYDPDFRKIFKIKADFSPDMDLKDENLEHFAKVLARICEKEELRPLSRTATGRLAESAVRHAGRKDKISTRFADIADIIREADYWCREEGADVIGREHVQRAIEERAYRSSGLDSRIQNMMEQDVLVIRTEGAAVGQVNGLSVYDLGYHAFGKPTLITATTAVGQAGIISIEREARLSGGIYDKGVLIIGGYFRRLFARNRPLALTASLCFEQSYSGVDGDSASITEIFALLSDLSGIPLDQGIAVTGSINQRGEIQPIGGANEKIEGFFRLCLARGLTGEQGVIIPKRNVDDLMLHPDVVAAVRAKQFHIYAVSSIEDGIEILTGVKAGKRAKNGQYPQGTIFRAVDDQLRDYLDALRGREDDWKPIQSPMAVRQQVAETPADPPGLPPRPRGGR